MIIKGSVFWRINSKDGVPLLQGSGSRIYLHLSKQTPQGISPSPHHRSSPHIFPKNNTDTHSFDHISHKYISLYASCKSCVVTLTASISLRAFHCSYGTPRCSAVWMLLHSWLVHTFRSFSCCSSTNRARAAENCSGEGNTV